MPILPRDIEATQRFIDYRPVSVVVSRTAKTATPDGGWTRSAPVAQPAQDIRIVELLRAQATQERINDDGVAVFPTHVGVTLPTADFQRRDTFTAYGERWEVLHVSRLPEWRLSLELYSRGPA